MKEIQGKGGCLGHTAESTFALMHAAEGQKLGLRAAADYETQFTKHGMLEVEDGTPVQASASE